MIRATILKADHREQNPRLVIQMKRRSFLRLLGGTAIVPQTTQADERTVENPINPTSAHSRIRNSVAGLGEIAEQAAVTAEMFGAVGDGTADDDAAMVAMCNWGREHGRLHWIGQKGKTYTTKHAHLFCGIEYLTLDFNGSAIMNTHGGVTDVGFVSNNEGLHFGTIFITNGHEVFTGNYYAGETIATASAGDTGVEVTGSLDGTGLTAGARVFIYGFSGGGFSGFPPDPRVSEYNEIESVDGRSITLRRRLKYDYDARWPDGSGTFVFGAPRIISADRSNFKGYRRLIIYDINVVANPKWTTASANLARNGRVTIGGFDYCEIRGGRMDGGMYVSQGKYVHASELDVRGGIEFDKCIDEVVFRGSKCLKIGAGVGVRSLILEDVQAQDLWNLSPAKNLIVRRGRLVGLSASRNSVLGPTSSLTENISIEGTEFIVTDSTKTCLFSGDYREILITKESDSLLSISRSQFDSSQIARFMSPDAMFYTAIGVPAFRLGRMPYEIDGVVYFEGESLTSLSTDDKIRAFCHRNITTRDLVFGGPYGKQIRTLGRAIATPVNIDSSDIGPDFFAFDQRVIPVTGGSIANPIGKRMFINRISVDVLRPYTGNSETATLRLRNYGGATLFTVNLKTAGCRVIDVSGTYNLASGDSGSIDHKALWIVEIRVTKGLSVRSDVEGALWSIRCEGVRTFL
ncbi:hypothetical protein [Mesorhizobium sp. M0898]|uniref:hypothetical protein n=1 Tax=Mesorhizobium sp. M0898 TaxID=2957020 RepID=UPI003337F54D